MSWYFDERIFAQEQRLLFDDGPGYIGHELMVPAVNDYRSLDWQDHASLLVRSADGVFELSNICRHRQAVMLEGCGNAERIVCPLHRWTYDNRGTLLGAPSLSQPRPETARKLARSAVSRSAIGRVGSREYDGST